MTSYVLTAAPFDLVNDALTVMGLVEAQTGVLCGGVNDTGIDDAGSAQCINLAAILFHLTEDDYELVGGSRRYSWDEFSPFVRWWYARECAWQFGPN